MDWIWLLIISMQDIFTCRKYNTPQNLEDVLIAVQKKNLQIRSAKAGINIISSNGLCVDILSGRGLLQRFKRLFRGYKDYVFE